jgi:hypothetical protein
MSSKPKEARFVFVPEVQNISTTFTYNFFEKNERENISERYRTIKNVNRLTRNEIDNFARFVTVKFRPHHIPHNEKYISISRNLKRLIEEDDINNKNFIGFQFQDKDVEESFYSRSQAIFDDVWSEAVANSPLAKLLIMNKDEENDDAFLSEVFTNIETSQPRGNRAARSDIDIVKMTASFNDIRDLSFGAYFSNKNVGFISADMKNDKTTPYADEFIKKFSDFKPSNSYSDINDEDQRLTIISQRKLEENETVKPKSYIVGYIIEKFEVLKSGKTRKMKPIVVQGINRSSVVDRNVRYGGMYRYKVKTISASVFEATSIPSRTGDNIRVEATALVASSGSPFSDILCDEKIPPAPPENLLFKYDYKTDSLLFSWDFPLNTQRDIKRFQVYRRKNIKEPFALLREFNFDNSTIKARSPASGNRNNVKRKSSPELLFIDTEFNVNSKYIYALASIDARGLTSGYSAQLEVSYDRFKNRIKSTYISRPDAPKSYPNIYLERDTFPDVIKHNNYNNIKVFFNPEYKTVIKTLENGDKSEIDVLKVGNANKYKLQIINTDLQEMASFDFYVDEK